MVSSAVLGAAAGTGLALVIAVTIVVYRYYTAQGKVKSWSSLDRWPDPPKAPSLLGHHPSSPTILRQQLRTGSGAAAEGRHGQTDHRDLEACHLPLDCHRKPQPCYYSVQNTAVRCAKVTDKLSEVFGDVLELACGQPAAGSSQEVAAGSTTSVSASSRIGAITGVAIIRGRWTQRQAKNQPSSTSSSIVQESQDSLEEFNATREHHAVQPTSSTDSGGGGQQGSRPGSRMGLVMGRTLTSLSRQASTSSGSQEQLPPASADQQPPYQQQPLQHQSSSPQIRTYGPDGRHHEALHAASSYPPSRGSRSPSPVRAASLDARSSPSPLVLTSGQSSGGSLCSLAGSSQLQAITHHQQSCGGPSPAHHHSPKQPSSSSSSSSSGVAHQHQPASPGRCLSPLLIPPPRASFSLGDSGSGPPASPLGALQPDLYRSRAEPIILPSSSRRSGKSLGRLHLRLSYDYDKSDLDVYLIKGENIPSSDHGGFNDPYIKLTLSPEVDARKRQTPVWSHEPNPHFDQHFKFPVSHDELQDKTLIVQVLDFDRTSRNDMFGSVRVILDELNLTSSTSPVEIVGDISRERKPPEETQEVLISLSYLPSAQRLTLVVHRARNLFPGPGRDTLDPFVKVGLLSNDRRVKKKKTAVCKATRSPAWDEAMSFNVPTSALGSSAIEICVVDSSSEAAGNDAIIGTCIIGPGIGTTSNYDNAPNPSREHWLVMANSPRQTISKWHVLH